MKRVIKNPKKMKNAMYVVFGVFALALFVITRTGSSYATDGLMIDNALDSIVLYGEVEQLAEDEEVQESQDDEIEEEVQELEGDEEIVEPEETTKEEIKEENETSEDLDETVLERDNKGIDGLEIGGNEGNAADDSEKIEGNVAKGTESSNLDKITNKLGVMDTDTFTVSFDVDGGTPRDSITVTGGSKLIQNVKKYSSTSNIGWDGTRIGNYANSCGGYNGYESVNIPGATKLHVTLTYGTEANYDYVYVFSGRRWGNVTNNISSDQLLYKYNGGSNNLTTVDFYVDGDTVTFAFYSDSSQAFYGYYAVVEPVTDMPNNPTKEGKGFDGWYKSDGEKWSFTGDTVEENVTLYAHWRDPEAVFLCGNDFSKTLKSISAQVGAINYSTQNSYIKKVIHANSLTSLYDKRLVSDPNSDIPVYAWFDASEGTIYYYSEADEIYLNSDIVYMFANMNSLNTIDLVGVNMSRVNKSYDLFYGTYSVKTIYATDQLLPSQYGSVYSTSFFNSSSYVGGNGTKYSSNNDNANFARPDTRSQSGYFTDPREITVKFKVFGNEYTSSVVSKGQSVNRPDNPELDGYDFEGWYTDENFTTGFDFSQGIERYTEVYARMDGDEAILLPGKDFDLVIKKLANSSVSSYGTTDNLIKSIKKADNIAEGVNKQLVSVSYSAYPVYARYKDEGGTGTIYYYSEAPKIYMNPNSSHMFYDMRNLEEVNLRDFDTSRVTSLESMFYHAGLKSLDLSNTDFSSVKNMEYFFQSCEKIEEADFSNIDLSGIEEMNWGLFYNIKSLKSVNLSGADFSSAKGIGRMFGYCDNLESVDFTNSKFGNLLNMQYLFSDDSKLNNVKFTNSNLGKVTSVQGIVLGCNSLTGIDFSYANLGSLLQFGDYGFFPSGIQEVNFEGTDLRSLTTMYALFQTKYNLKNVNFSGTRLDSVQDMSWMFASSNMTGVDFSNAINLNSVTNMNYMFQSSYALQKVDFGNAYLGNVTTMDSMFNYCTSLGEIHFGNLDFHSLKNTSAMFRRTIFTGFDFEGADFSSLENTNYMFESCDNLESLNFSGAKFGKKISYAFEYCKNLKEINFYGADFSTVEDMSNMFYETRGLKNINFDNIKTNSNLTNMYSMFSYSGLTGVDLSNFDTSNVTNMSDMFYNCTGLDVLDLSNFDTSNVTGMNNMFGYAKNLSTIYVSDKFTLDKVTSSGYMFAGATNLVGGNGTTFNPEKIDGEYARIDTLTTSGYFTNILDKPYTITYYTNEGILSGEKTIYTQRDSFTLPIPIRTGYTFLGWTGSNGLEPEITVNIAEFTVGDLEYTANWGIGKYKIIFDTDGGNEINPIEKDYNSLLSGMSLPSPTKECNEFSGWDIELPEIMPAHDITLKAIWNYTCSRSSGGGGGAKKSESTTREIAIDTSTEQEHNSANEEQNSETSETSNTPTNGETTHQVISVTQEVSEDGTVEAIVETVKIKNTNIVATVRTEVSSASSSSSSSSSTTHTKEQNDAYSFAKSNGITTTSSIEDAKMNTELTRIQMAKMLSNFAINVLGQEPDPEKGIVKFNDVTNKMDKQYDNAVTKAYQLGIMGQNMKNNEFRPSDTVTRAEFASALSRLLYQTEEGEYKGTGKYYIPHVSKLYNEGIVNKTDPEIKEKRGYVMTMLMRTVE